MQINLGAYFIRFQTELIEDDLRENDENPVEVDVAASAPFSGLSINVTLTCPLRMAPYKLLKELERKHDYPYTVWQGKKKPTGRFVLDMEFNCESARSVRLPPTHCLKYCQVK